MNQETNRPIDADVDENLEAQAPEMGRREALTVMLGGAMAVSELFLDENEAEAAGRSSARVKQQRMNAARRSGDGFSADGMFEGTNNRTARQMGVREQGKFGHMAVQQDGTFLFSGGGRVNAGFQGNTDIGSVLSSARGTGFVSGKWRPLESQEAKHQAFEPHKFDRKLNSLNVTFGDSEPVCSSEEPHYAVEGITFSYRADGKFIIEPAGNLFKKKDNSRGGIEILQLKRRPYSEQNIDIQLGEEYEFGIDVQRGKVVAYLNGQEVGSVSKAVFNRETKGNIVSVSNQPLSWEIPKGGGAPVQISRQSQVRDLVFRANQPYSSHVSQTAARDANQQVRP